MSEFELENTYLTGNQSPPSNKSYRHKEWCKRGYQPSLAQFCPDSEIGMIIGQMGWVGSHSHSHGYLWGSAGNAGYLLQKRISENYLLPISHSPRYQLPPTIVVKNLAGRHVLLSKSGCRLDMIAIEPPSLNVTVLEVEDDGCHYRMRLGTPSIQQLNQMRIEAPKPTSEFFHYMLIFDRLGDNGFNALVHLQPKFLILISRSEHGSPSRFYNFLRGYEPETPIIYDQSGGIGLVMEKAPGIPDLSFESLRLFTGEDLVEDKRSNHRHVIYWIGHGTFSRGNDILDAYRHAEYFESAARMAWEANQKSINAQAYTDDIVSCIMQEFQKNQTTSSSQNSFNHPQENLFNY